MEPIEIPVDSLLTATVGIYSTLGEEINEDSLTTAVASTATTATANPTKVVIMEDTMAYVESLSDEQLEKLSMMLDEKEISIESIRQEEIIEKSKTYIK